MGEDESSEDYFAQFSVTEVDALCINNRQISVKEKIRKKDNLFAPVRFVFCDELSQIPVNPRVEQTHLSNTFVNFIVNPIALQRPPAYKRKENNEWWKL